MKANQTISGSLLLYLLVFLFCRPLNAFSHFNPIIDSLETVLQNSSSDSARLGILIQLCDETTYNNSEKAIRYFKKAEQLAKRSGNNKALARAYERAGIIYFHIGKKQKSRDYYLDAYRVNQKVGDYEISASIMYNLGNIHYELGNFDSTLHYADMAAEIFLGGNDSIGYAATQYLKIGAYKDQGDYATAMDVGLQALRIFRRYGVKNWEMYSLNNIADIYVLQDDYDEGLSLLNNVIAHYRTTNNKKFEAVALRYKGDIYLEMENYEKADSILNESYHIAVDGNFLPEKAKTLLSLANLAFLREEYKLAKTRYAEALDINLSLGDKYYTGVNLLGLGKSEYHLRLDSSLLHLNSAAKIMADFNEPSYLKDLHFYIFKIREDQGKYPAALESYKLYAAYRDTLLQEKKSKELAETTIQYKSEQKEERILNLENENELVRSNRRKLIIIGILIIALALTGIILLMIRNRKNRQLVEKSREVERMKSRFFANISHEFRTPITLILSPIYELQKDQDMSKHNHILKLIEHNAKRLLNLVNQILDLSKLEAGRYDLKPERNDIIAFVKRIIASFESLAASRSIRLSVEIPSEGKSFVFDPEILETILNNILSNAIKNEPEKGHIHISFYWNQPGNNFKLVVRNEGSYILPGKLDQVFNRFYTETSSKENVVNNSTGIGLALTSELVNLTKGKIRVFSNKEEGTSFELLVKELELKENKTIPSPEKFSNAYNQLSDPSNERKKHAKNVLVVEDNRDMRNFVDSVLSSELKVTTASDGKTGLEIALETIPDIIVTDIMMPGMDGTELCRKLKTNEKTSHIPVILLSAKDSDESRIEGLKALADDYVSKPFHSDELLQRIRNQLNSAEKLKEKYSKDLMYKSSPLNINSTDELFFEKLNNIIEESISNDEFSVEELSQMAGMSRSQLHRKLTGLAGLSASQYVRNYRLKRAHELLDHNAASVSEIAYMTGFSSPAYFNKCFREFFGSTPGDFMKKRVKGNR